MIKLISLFLFLINLALADEVTPPGVASYGELYLVDQPNDFSLKHRLSLGGGYDVANNFRDIYNTQIQYAYSLSDLFDVGIQAKVFMSSETDLKKRIDQEFDLVGLQIEGLKPQWSSYLMMTFIPIQGRVNFFSKRSIPVIIAVSAGPGVRRVQDRGELWGWQLSFINRFYISKDYSVEIQFSQEMEAAFEGGGEKSTRHQLNILGGYSF